ncbi:MAG: hypothetical protein AAF633_24920, partial [Chloroflexota bacterium]
PFLPILKSSAQFSRDAIAEMIVQNGGNVAWEKAKAIWAKIRPITEADEEVAGATLMLSSRPETEMYQTILISLLAERINSNSELIQSLEELLGGQSSIQELVANNSILKRVSATSKRKNTTQVIKLTDTEAEDITQHIE